MLSRVEPVWGNAGTPGCGRGGKIPAWQEIYAQFYFWTFLHEKSQKWAADVGMYLVIHIPLSSAFSLLHNVCTCVHVAMILIHAISVHISILVKGQYFLSSKRPLRYGVECLRVQPCRALELGGGLLPSVGIVSGCAPSFGGDCP